MNIELRNRNFNRGLADGYFKTFDMFDNIPIGLNKYPAGDFLNEFKSYYTGLMFSMWLTFCIIVGSLILSVFFIYLSMWTAAYFCLIIYLTYVLTLVIKVVSVIVVNFKKKSQEH